MLLTDTLQRQPEASQAIHIVLLIDQFPRVLGGGERVVLRNAALLTRAGYRVSIITFAILCTPETLQGAACPILLLPLTGVFQPAAVRAAWQFGRFLRREKVRVVQTFFESANLFGGIVTKALSSAKLIWNRRDMGILRTGKHRLAYRLLPRLPDAVIAVSEQVRQHAIEVDGIPANQVAVVYNGLNVDQRANGSIERATPPRVVTVGNLRPVKGHDVLVKAAALVLQRHPSTEFVIAGAPLERDFFEALQRSVATLKISDRITFPGSVADPTQLLQSASIFVLPSRSEGFSNAIVEAMMAGLPVVATTVGGNGEAVLQNHTGLLVPPDDPGALAAAICALLDDPEQLQAMGEAGQERALSLFTEEGTLRQMVAVLDQVLKG